MPPKFERFGKIVYLFKDSCGNAVDGFSTIDTVCLSSRGNNFLSETDK